MSAHLEETLRAFADACAYIQATIPARITNIMRMQAMLYYDVRGRFGLSSNLAQQTFVCAPRMHQRVAANRKAARTQGEAVPTFEPASIQYDQQIFARSSWNSLTLTYRCKDECCNETPYSDSGFYADPHSLCK